MSKFTVSKSSLQQFFSGCPAKLTFYRKYNLAKMPPQLQFGIDVHARMEQKKSDSKFGLSAISASDRLLNWVEKGGYKILAQEVEHVAPLTDDIQLFGIIDAIAEDKDGVPILIDWKTGSRLWQAFKTEEGEIVWPNAAGWQGTIYLTKPYESDIIEEWPDHMKYVLVPEDEGVAEYDYWYNEEDRQNLIRCAQILKDASDRGYFPKNKGYLCQSCDWMPACWELRGWEDRYIERGGKDES